MFFKKEFLKMNYEMVAKRWDFAQTRKMMTFEEGFCEVSNQCFKQLARYFFKGVMFIYIYIGQVRK